MSSDHNRPPGYPVGSQNFSSQFANMNIEAQPFVPNVQAQPFVPMGPPMHGHPSYGHPYGNYGMQGPGAGR